MRRVSVSPLAHVLLLVALAIFLYLPSLGTPDVVSNDEARYLVTARNLLAGGEWFIPRQTGTGYFSSLYVWLLTAAGLPGGPTGLSARVPSALAAIGGVLVTYLLGLRLFGIQAGLLSALLLATSAGYFWHTRTIGPDLAFTFVVLLAFLAFDLWRQKPASGRYLLLFFSSTAVAVSLKGLVGLVLPLLPVVLYLHLRAELGRVKGLGWTGALMVGGSMVVLSLLPTVFAIGSDHSGWLKTPFAALLGGVFNLPHSLLFHGQTLLTGFLPWSLFLPSAAALSVLEFRRRGLASPLLFSSLWGLIGFGLLTLLTVRRSGHLLPLYPALALLVGWAWETVGSETVSPGWRLALALPPAALAMGVTAFGLTLASGAGVPVPGPAAPFLSGESSGAFLLGLTGVSAGVLSLLSLLRGRYSVSIFILVLLVIPAARAIEDGSVSRHNQHHRLPALAKVVQGLLNSGSPVWLVDDERPAVELYVGRKLPILRGREDLRSRLSSRSTPTYLLAGPETLGRHRSVFSESPVVIGKATVGRSPVLLVSPDPPSTGTCRVVLVSVDGLRPDAIGRFHTPVLSRLARTGAFAWKAETVRPSRTLSAHVAMVAGVGPEKSGVWSPTAAEPRIQRPTVFEVVRRAGLKTAMFAGKQSLAYLAGLGAIDHADIRRKGDDAAVMAAALAYLSSARPTLTFIHLADTDRAGHRSGWMSRGQGAAIEEVDRLIGELVERLTSAPGLGPVLLIVTADHGGKGRKHYRRWFLWPSWRAAFHRVPWIGWGKAVKRGFEIPGQVWLYDTAPTVLYALGLGSPLDWDGGPLTEIFVDPPWKVAASAGPGRQRADEGSGAKPACR